MQNSSITNWHVVGGREMAISNEAWLTLTPWHPDLATQPENHRSLTCTTNDMFTELCNHWHKNAVVPYLQLNPKLSRIEWEFVVDVGCTCLWLACPGPKMNIPCSFLLVCTNLYDLWAYSIWNKWTQGFLITMMILPILVYQDTCRVSRAPTLSVGYPHLPPTTLSREPTTRVFSSPISSTSLVCKVGAGCESALCQGSWRRGLLPSSTFHVVAFPHYFPYCCPFFP